MGNVEAGYGNSSHHGTKPGQGVDEPAHVAFLTF